MSSKSRSILGPFEDYQKARFTFVQKIADLAHRPQNIVALHSSGVMPLLRPLLLDSVQAIQQSAALAIGRLANYSKEIAESVIQNDIITQLIYSLSNQNKFYKKAACYVLRAVAKHSTQLAEDVVKCGALDPLIQNLSDFDIGVKESAAWALGYIAKHSEGLADQVVSARSITPLMNCLKDSELSLNRAAATTLIHICQHSENLAKSVSDAGLETITQYLGTNDVQLKRCICLLLGNIAKHSNDLAHEVWKKISDPKLLLVCLLDSDDMIRRNAAACISEIVNKGRDKSESIVEQGGLSILTYFISNTQREESKLPGIVALGNIAAHDEKLAQGIIDSEALPELRKILETSNNENLKAAVCFTLGHIGKHAPKHAGKVAAEKVLPIMLDLYNRYPNESELKNKSKAALRFIITNCDKLSNLEPLLVLIDEHDSKILKCIIERLSKLLKNEKDNKSRQNFVANEGLKNLLTLKMKRKEGMTKEDIQKDDILISIENIANSFSQNVRNACDPEYFESIKKMIDAND